MEYQDRHTEIIVECAKKIRRIQETQIEPLFRIIENELSNKFPSLNGKQSDGVSDWACDIQNCDTDDEVIIQTGLVSDLGGILMPAFEREE